jgi:hypothetical protein
MINSVHPGMSTFSPWLGQSCGAALAESIASGLALSKTDPYERLEGVELCCERLVLISDPPEIVRVNVTSKVSGYGVIREQNLDIRHGQHIGPWEQRLHRGVHPRLG